MSMFDALDKEIVALQMQLKNQGFWGDEEEEEVEEENQEEEEEEEKTSD